MPSTHSAIPRLYSSAPHISAHDQAFKRESRRTTSSGRDRPACSFCSNCAYSAGHGGCLRSGPGSAGDARRLGASEIGRTGRVGGQGRRDHTAGLVSTWSSSAAGYDPCRIDAVEAVRDRGTVGPFFRMPRAHRELPFRVDPAFRKSLSMDWINGTQREPKAAVVAGRRSPASPPGRSRSTTRVHDNPEPSPSSKARELSRTRP
jgi:hypothetical protein